VVALCCVSSVAVPLALLGCEKVKVDKDLLCDGDNCVKVMKIVQCSFCTLLSLLLNWLLTVLAGLS